MQAVWYYRMLGDNREGDIAWVCRDYRGGWERRANPEEGAHIRCLDESNWDIKRLSRTAY